MSVSNCVKFVMSLAMWRYKRWKGNKSLPEPYIVFRFSRAGGPFHMLFGTLTKDGKQLRLISYKPLNAKENIVESVRFAGKPVRGDKNYERLFQKT